MVDLFICRGADINVKNKVGQTPLFMPAICGYRMIVALAIEKGADVNIKDDKGRTCLDIARAEKEEETVKLLLQHGAKSGKML
ncbi:MAG: Ankyrin [uncultured bacterium]|nr:MAG: Ankyrin [uncultured bacterium]